MKYFAICNDDDMKVVLEILKAQGINVYTFDSAEDRFITETAIDSLDIVLSENDLSVDDIFSIEEKVLDITLEKVKEDDDFYSNIEPLILEKTREVFHEAVDTDFIEEWAKDLNFSNSDILEICSNIENVYQCSKFNLDDCYNKFKNYCAIFKKKEDCISYLKEENIDINNDTDNLFELNNGYLLLCM